MLHNVFITLTLKYTDSTEETQVKVKTKTYLNEKGTDQAHTHFIHTSSTQQSTAEHTGSPCWCWS